MGEYSSGGGGGGSYINKSPGSGGIGLGVNNGVDGSTTYGGKGGNGPGGGGGGGGILDGGAGRPGGNGGDGAIIIRYYAYE